MLSIPPPLSLSSPRTAIPPRDEIGVRKKSLGKKIKEREGNTNHSHIKGIWFSTEPKAVPLTAAARERRGEREGGVYLLLE